MSKQDTCIRGHLWTEETTYWRARGNRRYRECATCISTRTPASKKKQAIRLSQMEVVRQKADVTQPCQRDFCNGKMLLDDYDDPYCNSCGRGTTAIMVAVND